MRDARRSRGGGRCTRRCRAPAAPRGPSSARNVQCAPVAIRILNVSCRSLGRMVTSCGERHRAPLVELAPSRAGACARAGSARRGRACRTRQSSPCSSDRRCTYAVLVGQLEVGEGQSGFQVLAHRALLSVMGAMPGTSSRMPVDARQRGDVERRGDRRRPRRGCAGPRAAAAGRGARRRATRIQTPPGPQT